MCNEDILVTTSLAVAKWLAQGRSIVELGVLESFFELIACNLEMIKQTRECCELMEARREQEAGEEETLVEVLTQQPGADR